MSYPISSVDPEQVNPDLPEEPTEEEVQEEDEVMESVKQDEREEKQTIMEEMAEIEGKADKLGNLIDAKTCPEIKAALTK